MRREAEIRRYDGGVTLISTHVVSDPPTSQEAFHSVCFKETAASPEKRPDNIKCQAA